MKESDSSVAHRAALPRVEPTELALARRISDFALSKKLRFCTLFFILTTFLNATPAQQTEPNRSTSRSENPKVIEGHQPSLPVRAQDDTALIKLTLLWPVRKVKGLFSPGVNHKSEGPSAPPVVDYCDLISNPQKYEGQDVAVRATYRYGFEWQELFCLACRGVGKTWLEFDEAEDGQYKSALKKFPKEQGTVNGLFIGTFHGSNGRYGDGGYRFKMVVRAVSEAELLSKSGWDPQQLPTPAREKVCGGQQGNSIESARSGNRKLKSN